MDVPVLVVGAGPVGMATAAFLSRWGVRALVVDKRDARVDLPRASTSLRTLEVFRSAGLGPAFDRASWLGSPPSRSVYKETALARDQRLVAWPPEYEERLAAISPVDARRTMTQREVRSTLLAELRRREVPVWFGWRLAEFDGSVRATLVNDAEERREVTARYLVAADGARSGIRERLGITMPDRVPVARLDTAFFRADLGDVFDRWGTHACFVRNDTVYATLFSKNGRDQWSSHIMDHSGRGAALSEAKTIELLHAALGTDTVPIELHAVHAWEAAIGTASAFRSGRVFLAGDAAHVQSSAGGLGMNTGIQDAHNLAWKLASVLSGTADPALLDTYDPERRAAAAASQRISRRLHEGYRDGEVDLSARLAEDYLRGMICYGYSTTEHDVFEDAAEPGYRYPHRWVRPGVSTLDLIGSEWTVLTGTGGDQWLEGASALGIAAHRTEDEDGVALVRPDGFVCWRGAVDAPPGELAAAMTGFLRRGEACPSAVDGGCP